MSSETTTKRCMLCAKPHYMGGTLTALDNDNKPLYATMCDDCDRKLRAWVAQGCVILIKHPDIPQPLVFDAESREAFDN